MEIRIIISGGSDAPVVQAAEELRADMDVSAHVDDIKRAYLRKAIEVHGRNYTKIAKALGLGSYQVAVNWCKNLGV